MRLIFGVSLLLMMTACSAGKKTTVDQDKIVEIIKSGTVYYDVEVEATDPNTQVGIGDKVTLYFNEKIARQEEEGAPMSQGTVFIELATGESISYLDFAGKKFAIKMTGPMMPSVSDIQYVDGNKMVAGYNCKKAIGQMNGKEVVMFYTNEIAANYAPYSNELKGFALAYSLPLPFATISYTANKLLTSAPPVEKMTRPEGYKLVTPMELQKEMMSQTPSFELEEIPDFTLSDLSGNEVQLSALKGKVVVLNFWFIACKPCQMEMPDLNELKADYAGKDVAFLGITFDNKDAVNQFLKTNPFEFQILPDAQSTIQDYGIVGFPTTVVLDKNGQLVDSVMGGSMNIKEIIQKMIEKGLTIDD